MASEKLSSRIDLGVWTKDLRRTFDTSPLGSGAVALLSILNLQLGQSASYVSDLSGDLFVERGLGSWPADHEAATLRLRWMVAKLETIASSDDPREVKLAAIYNYVARPVLDGLYPADMLAELPASAKRGIIVMSDGRGKGFGDAVVSASLWNQAVVAGDIDRRFGKAAGLDAIRAVLTQVAVQLETSAPGEDPTWADQTIAQLKVLAAAPGKILAAVGGPNLLLYGAIAAAVVFLVVRE